MQIVSGSKRQKKKSQPHAHRQTTHRGTPPEDVKIGLRRGGRSPGSRVVAAVWSSRRSSRQ